MPRQPVSDLSNVSSLLKKKTWSSTFFSWFFGLLLVLWALGSLALGSMSALFLLVLGLLLIPPLGRSLARKAPWSGGKIVRILIVFVLSVGFIAVAAFERDSEGKRDFKKNKEKIYIEISDFLDKGELSRADARLSKYLLVVPQDSKLLALRSKFVEKKLEKKISDLRVDLKKVDSPVKEERVLKELIKLIPHDVDLQNQLAVVEAKAKAVKEKMEREKAEAERIQRIVSDCKTDYKRCTDNEMLINHYEGMPTAKAACQIAAEKLAKWGDPQWDWVKFSTFYVGKNYVSSGVIRIVDESVKFQNGFGAYKRTKVACTYDLKTKSVDLVHAVD